MFLCPACTRPVAIARPRCLYCGAELPAEAVTAAEAKTVEVLAGPDASRAESDRVLLILDLGGVSPDTLARALGISAFDANQRCARGGFDLLSRVGKAEADALTAGLRAAGLAVFPIPELEARLRPLPVRGGELEEGLLRLLAEDGEALLGRGDVALVVRGPIAREYQAPTEVERAGRLRLQQKIRTATLDGGYLFHLHRKSAERPLELDPGNFVFGFSPAQGSLLELSLWLDALGVPSDDAFKKLAPALAPAAKRDGGIAGAARAFVHTDDKGALVLDNLEQFRFYSGWRAAVERRRG